MGHESGREFFSAPLSGYLPTEHNPRRRHQSEETDLEWPFGKLDGLDYDDIRETAYEIFFTSCRSSPGFGGRNALAYYSTSREDNEYDQPRSNSFSRVKRALGLKMLKRSQSKPVGNWSGFEGGAAGGSHDSPPQFLKSSKRPLTCAEIMRQQMGVTEQSDNRLRKTLMRTLVGQMGRRTETIILPLELLRNLKASEFDDSYKYHIWQKRQLKVLQLGILHHPYIPIDNSNPFALSLSKIIQSSEMEIMDTAKNSDTLRNLCNSVVSLSWRTHNGSPGDVCHWVDGYPVNVNLYVALLQAIFDARDETSVLDEVDELLELMKNTWCTLGIDKSIHNVCLTWVFFNQYVLTSQLEPDLLCASHAILTEVAGDAKINKHHVVFHKVMLSVLNSIRVWSEKRLLSYHEFFQKGTISLFENLLPLVLTTLKIIEEDQENENIDTRSDTNNNITSSVDSHGQHIDNYIRSSLKTAFKKVIEFHGFDRTMEVKQEVSEAIVQLAKEAEELALNEKEWFSPILKKWHPMSLGVAAVTLHGCYGIVLKHYLECTCSCLSNETVQVLQRAGKLENFMVQMVVEDSTDCEDGGKSIVREMVPYEVDTLIIGLLNNWIDDRLQKGKGYVERAKQVETWNPKSKSEPYAQSAVEVMKLAKETINDFFEFSVGITEDLVLHLADALGKIFVDYINALVASCGSKQSYLPMLPPLTRCQQDSTFIKLCKIATPCTVSVEVPAHQILSSNKQGGTGHQPRPSTSRGTQRLYIRLNTLHYLLTHLHSLDKTLAISRRNTSSSNIIIPPPKLTTTNSSLSSSSTYFEVARSSILTASQAVSEVAAYRLIFLDSSVALYDTLYVGGDVSSARIQPALRILKQNLTLLCAILTERAQPLAIKEIMKACFEAFLRVLLAGGSSRMFYASDHEMIAQDFASLKRMFSTCGEGLMNEDVMEKESDVVQGVIALMGETTEELIADYNAASGGGQTQSSSASDSEDSSNTSNTTHLRKKLPIPPTTGKWSRSDPNTILRVLCHRVDRTATQFLKRSFQLSKRR